MATATTSAVIVLLLLLHMITVGSVVRADMAVDIGPDSTWITEPPEDGVAIRSKPYTLQCHSTLPNATYLWMYNNRTLDLVNDSRRQILPNGSLFFKTVANRKGGDAGSYRCIVQTPTGAVSSKTVTLLTAVIHDFDVQPSNVTVSSEASRSVIRFNCHVNSVPLATIMWQKNGVVLSSNNNKFVTKVPGVLYIKQVNENDAGEYRCVGKNHLLNKTKYSDVGHLVVNKINIGGSSGSQSGIQKLAFISPNVLNLNVKYVTEGDNVTFECVATGVPAPQLNWSFINSTGYRHNTLLNDEGTSVNILSLTRVSSKDSGTYTCHALQSVTGWPDLPHAQYFRLEVMTPPNIIIPPETQTMPIANTIRFRCLAEGNPTPNITWYHNGQRLKLNGRIKAKSKQLLLVSNTVSSDSGFYQCFASNQYGTVWAGAMLNISSSPFEPSPPINISCRTLSSTQIQVSWRKSPTDIPDDPPILVRDDSTQLGSSHSGVLSSSSATVSTDIANKVSRAYSIHYMPTDGGEETQQVSVNHSIIVEKLKPYKNYTFYVRVYNGRSGSDQSEKVTCKTQDGAPQTVPELIVTPLSPISLHVEWAAINVNLANGAVTQYQVMWKRLHSSSNYIQLLHNDARQYTITGLKPGEQYEVQVLGATQNGLPNIDFSWHLIELPGINPILPVPILRFSIDRSIIKLSWFVIDQSIKFDSYKLMYRITSQTNQTVMLLHTLRPDTNHHIIHYTSDLDVYEVLLNCVSESGEGESVYRIIAVKSDTLSPPSQIEAVATSLQTLNLSWVPPDFDDPSSLLFIISYNPVSNFSQNSTTVFTDSGIFSFELSGLKPYSLYEIKIAVQDKNNRKSEFSQKIQIRTLQGVPGIVEQIELQWINTSTVRITWVEPMKSNGVIMGYYVSYTSELHIPPTSWQQLNVSRHKNSLDLYGLSNNTQYFFMVRAATDAGFGPQSGIYSIIPLTTQIYPPVNSKYPANPPALYMEDQQLLGIVIGCVIGVCCILICTTSIVLKRQCVKAERVRDPQHNSMGTDVAFCAQHLRPFTIDRDHHEESVPLNDVNYITRHIDGRSRYSNNMSGMALPLLDQSNPGDHDITNVHIIENPQCTVDVDGYDVDSLLSESAEGGAGTEESGCSDQLAKSHKGGGDSSVVDDGFHEHVVS
ncbi:protogenin B-like [Rhopalosiphum padi]|uniref:protogenin B-like n=1 Tax=Rhopalosiphum padi TaxID=40932 RepID=UPI00298E92FC|nr:protogenin B-like [Rhopalosiphum padi]